MSELSDDKVDDIETKYKTGERVTAKVLKVFLLSLTVGKIPHSWTGFSIFD